MATFSVNQVRQLYVANALKTPHVVAADDAGSIAVKSDTSKSHLYFEYKGAANLMRSDLVEIPNIMSVKATDAKSMSRPLKKVEVKLDPTINSGVPVAGQDYILRISYRQFIGLSDEDMYFKFGMVHAYPGITASEFYKQMALSLAKNYSREAAQTVSFALKSSGADVIVSTETKESALTGTYTGIVIEEVPQAWKLGIMSQVPVYFEVQFLPITSAGDELLWGIAAKVNSTSFISNGKNTADLEYFCLGERGDIYRNVGFPNSITTQYLVNPDNKYNMIDLHYFYVGNNEGSQKSEKTITLVIPKIGATDSVSNVLANSIITAINTATGLTVPLLSTSAS